MRIPGLGMDVEMASRCQSRLKWIGLLFVACILQANAECKVGGSYFDMYTRTEGDLQFQWALSPGSTYSDCANIQVCIDPPDDICDPETDGSYGVAYFSGLTSGQLYTANITAIANDGQSSSQLTTNSTYPYQPSDMIEYDSSPHNVTLRIQAPCCGTIFEYYIVRYFANGLKEVNVASSGQYTYHTVEYLEPNTFYSFEGFTVSNDLESRYSDVVSVTTPQLPGCEVGGGYFYQDLSTGDVDELQFEWQLSPGSTYSNCSSIYVCIDPPDDTCDPETDGTEGRAYFGTLIPGQSYIATITAEENSGQITSQVTTGATNPWSPSGVLVTGVSSSSVALRIQFPCCGTIADNYTIRYNSSSNVQEITIPETGTYTYHTVEPLESATEYLFMVYTIGGNGLESLLHTDVTATTEAELVTTIAPACSVDSGSISLLDSIETSMVFTWSLSPGSVTSQCLSVRVCIDPEHDVCDVEAGSATGQATFYYLTPGLAYTATITARDNGGQLTSDAATGRTYPYPPTDVYVQDVSTRSLTLRITDPPTGTIFDNYLVRFYNKDSALIEENVTYSGDSSTYHEMEPLLPGYTYTFDVHAVSSGLISSDSTTVYATLGQEAPIDPWAGAPDWNSILVNWTAPYGVVDEYNVVCYKGEIVADAVVVPPGINVATCSTLQPYTTYNIDVCSVQYVNEEVISTCHQPQLVVTTDPLVELMMLENGDQVHPGARYNMKNGTNKLQIGIQPYWTILIFLALCKY